MQHKAECNTKHGETQNIVQHDFLLIKNEI